MILYSLSFIIWLCKNMCPITQLTRSRFFNSSDDYARPPPPSPPPLKIHDFSITAFMNQCSQECSIGIHSEDSQLGCETWEGEDGFWRFLFFIFFFHDRLRHYCACLYLACHDKSWKLSLNIPPALHHLTNQPRSLWGVAGGGGGLGYQCVAGACFTFISAGSAWLWYLLELERC
jgi:hypothetical protein